VAFPLAALVCPRQCERLCCLPSSVRSGKELTWLRRLSSADGLVPERSLLRWVLVASTSMMRRTACGFRSDPCSGGVLVLYTCTAMDDDNEKMWKFTLLQRDIVLFMRRNFLIRRAEDFDGNFLLLSSHLCFNLGWYDDGCCRPWMFL
jgi:hypothetical protein